LLYCVDVCAETYGRKIDDRLGCFVDVTGVVRLGVARYQPRV
jgi:hypothetical protein